jgi:hypothetical protein
MPPTCLLLSNKALTERERIERERGDRDAALTPMIKAIQDLTTLIPTPSSCGVRGISPRIGGKRRQQYELVYGIRTWCPRVYKIHAAVLVGIFT